MFRPVPNLEAEGQASNGGSAIANRKSANSNQIGDYELLEEIGRGGMGVVYRARQRSLDRVVAIKMMAFGPESSLELLKRFRAEAVSAASLHHPNIVAIHEVGIQEDRHFFVMDYVEGQSLARLVGSQPLPAERAASYVKTIAQAVHYAHERGILHRDLKPSNVLIDAQDQPRVVDFGLAKRLDDSQRSTLNPQLTLTGQVLGSPHYLPPEQATGQRTRISRRTDVYALGATLYHMLTGRPPFQAESLAQTLELVLHADPVSPRLLNPVLPADLDTICLKCLEKEPLRRYATAQEVADEVARFQAGEPIQARPLGPAGKAWRWCRRKPQVASLAAAATLTFLLGFAGVVWQWRSSEAQRRRAEAGELAALRTAYVSEINRAQQALRDNNPGRALELLNHYRPTGRSEIPARSAGGRDPNSESGFVPRPPSLAPDLRGWEWRYLWQQCQSEAEAVIGRLQLGVRSLDISSDGRWLFAGAERAVPKVWDLTTGEEMPWVWPQATWGWGAFSPDSRWLLLADQGLAAGTYGTISVWDLQNQQKVAPIVEAWPAGAIAFSPDGKRVGYGVVLTNAVRQVVLEFPSRERAFEHTGNFSRELQKGSDWVFTRDGRSIIGSWQGSGRQIFIQELVPGSEPRYVGGHRDEITALAISPDGRMLATGAGYTETDIRLWEVPSFRPLGQMSGHQAWITAVKFSPDGQTLASAAADQTIRLWDVPTKTLRRTFAGLPADVWRLSFSGDGQRLFTGSADGTIQRWSMEAQPTDRKPLRQATGLEDVVVAPDAKRFAGLRQGVVCLDEVEGTDVPTEVPELGTNNTCLLFSAAGQSLFAGAQNGEVRIWSLDHSQPLHCLRGPARPVSALRQDQQERTLVVIYWRGRSEPDRVQPEMDTTVDVQVWRSDDWRPQRAWTISGSYAAYAVSPDARWFAADGAPGTIEVRSLSGPPRTNTLSFPGRLCGLTFSPDARLLAAATREGAVKVFEVPSFRDRMGFRARPHNLSALAFSPDSQRLVTAGEGAEAIKLWDVATRQELITLPCEGEALQAILFSADGNQLVGMAPSGHLRFWRTPSLAEIDMAAGKSKGR
jgi:WD40 repeat protein/predicted Ser/Thr protein kinase